MFPRVIVVLFALLHQYLLSIYCFLLNCSKNGHSERESRCSDRCSLEALTGERGVVIAWGVHCVTTTNCENSNNNNNNKDNNKMPLEAAPFMHCWVPTSLYLIGELLVKEVTEACKYCSATLSTKFQLSSVVEDEPGRTMEDAIIIIIIINVFS